VSVTSVGHHGRMPFLLRLRLQDRPGALGAIATALGSAGVDILALDVVEHTRGGDAVDDIVIDLPDGGMPDSAVSACAAVPGVAVSFVTPYPVGAPLGRDLELVELMAERPSQAEQVLTAAVPDVFRLAWGVVLDTSHGTARVEGRSIGAPEDDGFPVDWVPLASATRLAVTDAHLPDGWRGAVLAAAPLGGRDRALVIGRHVNPDILDSEVVRLGYLATLAATLTTTASAGAASGPATAMSFDHVVLTVSDVERSVSWYAGVLGMTPVTFGNGRRAVHLGTQKINIHAHGDSTPAPVATHRTPGAADLCVVVPGPLPDVEAHLAACGVDVEMGPVRRTGARGPMTSLYVRDPDGNLVELGCYSP
jgi:catechol 2,3-dioxygenase-like lactoylglutathione lyase family enzyme